MCAIHKKHLCIFMVSMDEYDELDINLFRSSVHHFHIKYINHVRFREELLACK